MARLPEELGVDDYYKMGLLHTTLWGCEPTAPFLPPQHGASIRDGGRTGLMPTAKEERDAALALLEQVSRSVTSAVGRVWRM